MKLLEKLRRAVMLLSAAAVIVLVLMMLGSIDELQGKARVINYAGNVRGVSQRLVKQELNGTPSDAMLLRVDAILDGLTEGSAELGLVRLEGEDYLLCLEKTNQEWEKLKQAIYAARADESARPALFAESEVFFQLADDMVYAAEAYVDSRAANLRDMAVLAVFCLMLALMLLIWQTGQESWRLRRSAQLSNMAYVDSNTGLPNSRACAEQLEQPIDPEEGQVCCLMFDLNDLKAINDSQGHQTGDVLIREFSRILRQAAPQRMFVGRYGGDEFVAVLRGTNRDEIEAFLAMLACREKAYNAHGAKIRISHAGGYALSDEFPGYSLPALMDEADKRMYRQKMEMKAEARRAAEQARAAPPDDAPAE